MANTIVFLIIAAAIAFGWWRLSLLLRPYGRCLRCGGSGKNRWSKRGGKHWGYCKHCGGSGKRVRRGAKG